MRDALPNATYIGFTGTPIEAHIDVNTPQVFGQYIDVYDISHKQLQMVQQFEFIMKAV